MGGIHDFVMKADPLSKKTWGAVAKGVGIEEDVEGDVLGLSNEAKDVRQKKLQDQVDKLSTRNSLSIPVGTPTKVS